MEFKTAIDSLKQNSCPHCYGELNYDVQDDSIYISCECGNFEISAFRDKYNGSLMLYYLNQGEEGSVDSRNLKELQKVLYRNNTIKRKLFTITLRNQIF